MGLAEKGEGAGRESGGTSLSLHLTWFTLFSLPRSRKSEGSQVPACLSWSGFGTLTSAQEEGTSCRSSTHGVESQLDLEPDVHCVATNTSFPAPATRTGRSLRTITHGV